MKFASAVLGAVAAMVWAGGEASASASPPTGKKPLQLGVQILPSGSPVPQAKVEADFSVEEVEVDGVRFYKVRRGATTLYLPKVDQVSTSEFERAMCAPAGHGSFDRERSAGMANTRITSEIFAYAQLVNSTFQAKCSPTGTGQDSATNPASRNPRAERVQIQPEIGISHKPEGKGRETEEYKVFVRPGSTAPVGVGASF